MKGFEFIILYVIVCTHIAFEVNIKGGIITY